MTLTDSYGGTTVTAQIACITDCVATPATMYSASAGIRKVLCGVEHDVESPSGKYALSLAQGWLRSGEPHSVTGIIDGFNTVQCLPFGAWTWGAGGAVNPCSVQWEQAGYDTFTTAMWLGQETPGATYQRSDGTTVVWTAEMNDQMAAQFINYATMVAQTNHFYGWGVPRYGTPDEFARMLNGEEVGVWFSHFDVTNNDPQHRTTHTDHAPNYPRAQHMALAAAIYTGTTPGGTVPPVTPPATDWLDTVDEQDVSTLLDARIAAYMNKPGVIVAEDLADGTPVYSTSIVGALRDTHTHIIELMHPKKSS